MSAEIKEQQEEEREALVSIYDGDKAFKEINPTTYQYKYGEEGEEHTFVLELSWGENYPNDLPAINLNVFYNQHLVEPVKQKITEALQQEAEQWLGCGMTYTLFECLKDRVAELMEGQPIGGAAGSDNDSEDDDSDEEDDGDSDDDSDSDSDAGVSKLSLGAKPKKVHLTKAQKRRQWDQSVTGGERPRGHDWVDIVKHLSQCGNKDEQGAVPQNYDG